MTRDVGRDEQTRTTDFAASRPTKMIAWSPRSIGGMDTLRCNVFASPPRDQRCQATNAKVMDRLRFDT